MKKIDNFVSCLAVLKTADRNLAGTNDIYRTGVIGQNNITFELAWKAIQAVMKAEMIPGSEEGSPREIIKLAFSVGIIDDTEAWLEMLKSRNTSVHIYNEEEADYLIDKIFTEFIGTYEKLAETLKARNTAE